MNILLSRDNFFGKDFQMKSVRFSRICTVIGLFLGLIVAWASASSRELTNSFVGEPPLSSVVFFSDGGVAHVSKRSLASPFSMSNSEEYIA